MSDDFVCFDSDGRRAIFENCCVPPADKADNEFCACAGQHEAGANHALVQEVRDHLAQLLDVGLAEIRQLRLNLHVDFDIAFGGGVHGRL